MTRLIFVRHGETKINVERKLHRVNAAEVLTEKGSAQIEATALALKKMNPQIIYSSKELRAEKSAEILSDKLNIPLKLILGLEERNWGDFSDKPWPEVEVVLKQMSLEERYTYIPPNGESWKDAEERLVRAVHGILKQNKDKTIIIISHGGAIRILMPHLLHLSKEETFKYDPDNASLTVFDYEDGKFIKQIINDTSHLKKL